MKNLTRCLIIFILLSGVLMACSSGESNETSATDNNNEKQNTEESKMDGKKFNIVGDDVFTDFVEDRYDGLEIKLISAGYVSTMPDEVYERYYIPETYNGHLMLEVEITNTTDNPISFYEFALASEPIEDWQDDEEFKDKYIASSAPIILSYYDKDEYKEQLDFLKKYKLLANGEHTFLPNSSVRGLHLISFKDDDVSGNVFIHSTTLDGEFMFELEPSEETWSFSDVDYTVDYENYEEEIDKYE